MVSMKQTAVEYLISSLDALDEQLVTAPKTINYKSTKEAIINKAKEMEREQMDSRKKSWWELSNDHGDLPY